MRIQIDYFEQYGIKNLVKALRLFQNLLALLFAMLMSHILDHPISEKDIFLYYKELISAK